MGRITLPTEIIQSDKTPRTAVAFDKNSGVKQLSSTAREVLLIGQMVAAGTATANTVYDVLRELDGETLFGKGSIVDFAIKAAFKVNPFVKLSAIGITDAGAKGTGTFTFATTALVGTTLRVRIAGVLVLVDVVTGDTPTVIASNLSAAINANTSLPVTASPAAGVVTVTANNGGTVGNGIKLFAAFDTPTATLGTTVTLSGSVLSGGTGAVTLTNALAAAAPKRYHEIALLLDDSTSGGTLKTHLTTYSGAEEGKGMFGHQACNGSLSTCTTFALAINGPRNHVWSINNSESWSVAIAAAGATIAAYEETVNRPLNTLILTGLMPPPIANRWSRTEKRNLIDNGCTPLDWAPGDQVQVVRYVNTGVKNAASNFDYSTLDTTTWRALDYFRDNLQLMFDTNYPRARWADDDADGLFPPDVATPAKVKQDMIDVARTLQSLGIVQQVEKLKDQFLVEKVNTQCQFSVPANVIPGMHEKLGVIVLYAKTVTSV